MIYSFSKILQILQSQIPCTDCSSVVSSIAVAKAEVAEIFGVVSVLVLLSYVVVCEPPKVELPSIWSKRKYHGMVSDTSNN